MAYLISFISIMLKYTIICIIQLTCFQHIIIISNLSFAISPLDPA